MKRIWLLAGAVVLGLGRIVPIAIDDSFRRGLAACGLQG